MRKVYIRELPTPIGQLVLGAIDDKLCLCDWKNSKRRRQNDNRIKQSLKVEIVDVESFVAEFGSARHAEDIKKSLHVLERAEHELEEYLAGKRKAFDIPLLMAGTDFQKSVWQTLLTIPFGMTVSYLDIANQIGNPRGVRAVAQAIGSNPLAIFVPCHRVMGSNGSLTGFAGGLDAKRFLLELEKGARKGQEKGKKK